MVFPVVYETTIPSVVRVSGCLLFCLLGAVAPCRCGAEENAASESSRWRTLSDLQFVEAAFEQGLPAVPSIELRQRMELIPAIIDKMVRSETQLETTMSFLASNALDSEPPFALLCQQILLQCARDRNAGQACALREVRQIDTRLRKLLDASEWNDKSLFPWITMVTIDPSIGDPSQLKYLRFCRSPLRSPPRRNTDPLGAPITFLTLRGVQLNDTDLFMLNGLRNLEALDVSNTDVTGSFFATNVGFKLGTLRLEGCRLSSGALKSACIHQLKMLSLNRSTANDESIRELAGAEIVTLQIAGTDVTHTGLKCLADLNSLKEVWIDSHLTDRDSLNALRSLKLIQHVKIIASSKNETLVSLIAGELPGVKVTWHYKRNGDAE